jgi:hypothetical protein
MVKTVSPMSFTASGTETLTPVGTVATFHQVDNLLDLVCPNRESGRITLLNGNCLAIVWQLSSFDRQWASSLIYTLSVPSPGSRIPALSCIDINCYKCSSIGAPYSTGIRKSSTPTSSSTINTLSLHAELWNALHPGGQVRDADGLRFRRHQRSTASQFALYSPRSNAYSVYDLR